MFSYFIRKILKALFVYDIYKYFLKKEVKQRDLPKHIAFILDGNRRYSQFFGITKKEAYSFGVDKAFKVVEWCFDLGVKEVTLYVLSQDNLYRNKEDLKIVLESIRQGAEKLLHDDKISKYGIHVKFIGETSKLPEDIKELIHKIEEKTKNYKNFYVTVCIAYSGRYEIVNVIKELAQKVKDGEINIDDIKEDIVPNYLLTRHLPYPEPDLVIRTSGEKRLSGFLLWQANYSEFFFTDVLWPDFREIDLLRAIRDYQERKRRFGR